MLALPFSRLGHKNDLHSQVEVLMLALPIFTARASYRHAVASVRGTLAGIKNGLQISLEALMLALPIFTASHPATIVGVRVLNFCVRDGNRWTHTTINTNSMDGF